MVLFSLKLNHLIHTRLTRVIVPFAEKQRVVVDSKPNEKHFPEYPDESIAQWHDRLNVTQ